MRRRGHLAISGLKANKNQSSVWEHGRRPRSAARPPGKLRLALADRPGVEVSTAMNSTPRSESAGEPRRAFIKKTAAAAAVITASGIFKTPVYGQNQAPAPGRVLGANDRIRMAYVGTGKQGMEHVKLQKQYAADNNIVQVAVCDLYQRHLDQSRAYIGVKESDAYRDHRKLLERKDHPRSAQYMRARKKRFPMCSLRSLTCLQVQVLPRQWMVGPSSHSRPWLGETLAEASSAVNGRASRWRKPLARTGQPL